MSTILEAMGVASGGMFSIGVIMIVLLLLSSRRGLSKATAFALGYFSGNAIIGVIALPVSRHLSNSRAPNEPSLLAGLILTLLGVSFLALAARNMFKRREGPEKQPAFFSQLDDASRRKVMMIGAVLSVMNFKNLAIYLSAVSVLGTGTLSLAQSFLALPLILFVFCCTSLLPVVLSWLFPNQSTRWLAVMKHWLERHTRLLTTALLLIFGTIFLWKGIGNLWV